MISNLELALATLLALSVAGNLYLIWALRASETDLQAYLEVLELIETKGEQHGNP